MTTDPSRRGDLEILGYCLLQWASGRLPWEDKLTDKGKVAREKNELVISVYMLNLNMWFIFRYMKKPSSLVKACLPTKTPKCLVSYLEHVGSLTYEEEPDYVLLRQLFHKELTTMKYSDKPNVLDWILGKPKPIKVASTVFVFIHVLYVIIFISASCS